MDQRYRQYRERGYHYTTEILTLLSFLASPRPECVKRPRYSPPTRLVDNTRTGTRDATVRIENRVN
ncbi:hypothetical protein KIN20_006047 [Parelaphostrongylus tenuis]|uniref:Uncharacterized protein n=1 Tax=Parelaphostrongylus tenuis TaxID=148309 RepID=A0AAD5MJS8_PARTN|nr:hypothetical protein KIN20_006047 [Parelaphostrongylus tenuis]